MSQNAPLWQVAWIAEDAKLFRDEALHLLDMTFFERSLESQYHNILRHVFLCGSANQELILSFNKDTLIDQEVAVKDITVSTKILSGTSVFNIDNNEVFKQPK